MLVHRTRVFPYLDALPDLVERSPRSILRLIDRRHVLALGTREWGPYDMRLAAEYLEQARHFESIAKQEKDLRTRRSLEKQADAYRKRAEARARQLGISLSTRDVATAASVDEFA